MLHGNRHVSVLARGLQGGGGVGHEGHPRAAAHPRVLQHLRRGGGGDGRKAELGDRQDRTATAPAAPAALLPAVESLGLGAGPALPRPAPPALPLPRCSGGGGPCAASAGRGPGRGGAGGGGGGTPWVLATCARTPVASARTQQGAACLPACLPAKVVRICRPGHTHAHRRPPAKQPIPVARG